MRITDPYNSSARTLFGDTEAGCIEASKLLKALCEWQMPDWLELFRWDCHTNRHRLDIWDDLVGFCGAEYKRHTLHKGDDLMQRFKMRGQAERRIFSIREMILLNSIHNLCYRTSHPLIAPLKLLSSEFLQASGTANVQFEVVEDRNWGSCLKYKVDGFHFIMPVHYARQYIDTGTAYKFGFVPIHLEQNKLESASTFKITSFECPLVLIDDRICEEINKCGMRDEFLDKLAAIISRTTHDFPCHAAFKQAYSSGDRRKHFNVASEHPGGNYTLWDFYMLMEGVPPVQGGQDEVFYLAINSYLLQLENSGALKSNMVSELADLARDFHNMLQEFIRKSNCPDKKKMADSLDYVVQYFLGNYVEQEYLRYQGYPEGLEERLLSGPPFLDAVRKFELVLPSDGNSRVEVDFVDLSARFFESIIFDSRALLSPLQLQFVEMELGKIGHSAPSGQSCFNR